MNKAWLYLASAAALGLALVLIPLAMLASIEPTETYISRMQSLEGGKVSDSAGNPSHEIDALVFSFFIALAAYALIRYRTSRHPNKHFSPYPF